MRLSRLEMMFMKLNLINVQSVSGILMNPNARLSARLIAACLTLIIKKQKKN
jgi:hypothetical protein